MVETRDLRDQLIHTLLEETLAPERHVDLSERVVARAFPAPQGRRLRMWALTAAAVLVVGLIVWRTLLEEEEQDATGWLFETAAVAPASDGSARIELSDQGPTRFGAPASAAEDDDPATRAFLDHVDLELSIPDTLPGGWQLSRARLLDPARVRLTYRRGDDTLSVFVWRWPGDTAAPRRFADETTGRSFVLVRIRDLGIAFEGGQAEQEIWNEAAAAFASAAERQGEDR
jgi:hypothetical protein